MALAKRQAPWFVSTVLILGLGLAASAAYRPPEGTSRLMGQTAAMHHAEAARKGHLVEKISGQEKAGVQPHQNLDVLHYDFDIALDPAGRTIQGTVTMRFSPTASLSEVRLRLHSSLKVSAVTLDGTSFPQARRNASDIVLPLSPPLPPGVEHEVGITYGGRPTWYSKFGGGIIFSTHEGTPVAATEAEPFESYRWWPCVEDVSDKFTFDMALTVPSGMAGVSNGKLESMERNADGGSTYHWAEGYPIANYLVCANVTNYEGFEDAYTSLDGSTTMPITHYVYPEHRAVAERNFATIPDMIGYYAQLVGEYAFLDEKFGQVETPYPGMEHTTITAVYERWVTGDAGYPPGDCTLMYAHELAHHWWGDDVTCATWHDVWLNEGFGTYFEANWFAHTEGRDIGELMAREYDDGQYKGFLKGVVYVADENKPFNDEGAVYYKGAWALHMVRKVLGEENFWQAIRSYRAAHHYGGATTADFQAACEQAYGQSLGWFFDQWVRTPFRPVYHVTFAVSGGTCSVTIEQQQKHKITGRTTDQDVYVMPVDIALRFDDGTEETRTVTNDKRTQSFDFPVTKGVTEVVLDPGGWLLKTVK